MFTIIHDYRQNIGNDDVAINVTVTALLNVSNQRPFLFDFLSTLVFSLFSNED